MSNLSRITVLGSLLTNLKKEFTVPSRSKAKLTQTVCRNKGNHVKPKHRGWKKRDGNLVKCVGEVLATQNTCRWFPGLNVGFGRDATLFAMCPGRVIVTCEEVKLNWDHGWVKKVYEGVRNKEDVFYKKYFNVIPDPQHQRFKLIDTI